MSAIFAKLHVDILSDEKLMRAARKGAKHLHFLPWLFAFAKKVDDDGRLTVDGDPAEPDDIAAQIPCATPKQIAACLTELEAIHVLVHDEDGALRLAAWETRSGTGSKPSDAPESVSDRVRRFRKKRREERARTSSETPDETRSETPVTPSETRFTESVTPRARVRSREEEGEEELEGEKELEGEEERGALHANREVPSSSSRPVGEQLVSNAHRAAYKRILAKAPVPEAWDAEMSARLAGMHGSAITPEQLGEALLDYVGNGSLERPNFKHFRGYLNNAAQPKEPTPIHAARSNGSGSRNDAGRAAILLQSIRELVEEHQQPGQPARRFIRAQRIEEKFGAAVLKAYKAIGGYDRVLDTTPDKQSFLIRDFSQALEAANAAA